jgi:hypothetical protein
MNIRCLAALLALLVFTASNAQEEPIVRAEITPAEINVGEPARLRITVLVPTWFPRPPVFPSFELSNAITRLPPDSSFPTSERVGADTWSGIVRNYRIYPMIGASYRIDGLAMRVTYANPGSDPVVADVAIPAVEFRGVVPAGAETLDPYLAGSRFDVTRELEGDVQDLEAGDALVLRYIAELDGLPAMFIPPLAPDIGAAGVSVYADQPVVEDGEPARRTETVTLVFDTGGEFALPGVDIDWWNVESQQLESAAIEPMTFRVTGPAPLPPPVEESVAVDWRSMLAVILVAGLLIVGYRHALPRIRETRAAARAARARSEQFAFRELQSALRNDQAAEAHRRMLVWLARIAPDCDIRSFARRFGDAGLQADVSDFIAMLFAASTAAPDLAKLSAGLAKARHACLRDQTTTRAAALPPLNP